MIDGITKHILAEGFNDKIRELRENFLSRDEFESLEEKFMKEKDLQMLEHRITQQGGS